MLKIKFIGQSDDNFENGNNYYLVNIQYTAYESIALKSSKILAFITNKFNKIVCIPYSKIQYFNDNWEVIQNGEDSI